MHEQSEHKHAFLPLPQQTRELSCNHSVISSTYNSQNSYQQLLSFFQTLHSPTIDMKALHSAEHLRLKKYKEAVYYGQYRENRREGKGIMLYHNGQRYDGQWRMDQRQGHGHQIFANGSIYEGEYVQNKMQGQGKYLWPNGETYEGEWNNNMKHGSGMWLNQEGNSYVGEWVEGAATGFGVFTEAKASRYEGDFDHFVKAGKGTQKFITGDLYQGHYQDGKFHGLGEYFWKDGSTYKGEFQEGKKHGYGVWRKGDSNEKYQGLFQQNRKQGFGVYTWANGNIYKGHYHANLRHGTGQVFWNDGTFYKGSWVVDKPNGKGTLFDGQQLIKGVFKDGQLVDYNTPDEEHRGISQFYLDNIPTRRVVGTPIRKITSGQFRQRQIQPRLSISQVQKDSEVRQIHPSQHNRRRSQNHHEGSFVRRKLMETIHHEHRSQSRNNNVSRSMNAKSQSRQKVLHSAFQIHRLYKNRPKATSVHPPLQATSDNREGFAFRKNGDQSISRYSSRKN